MRINDYQLHALRFRMPTAFDPMYPLLNLPSEVGELCGLIAKGIRDGKKPDHQENILKELGDVLWMVAAIAQDNGFDLDVVAAANIDKLESRMERNVLSGSGDNR